MKFGANKKTYKRIALALSLCTIIVWGVLGAGVSLAWFTDSSPHINNIFHFADFNLEVSHLLDDGSWELVDDKTKVFDNEAEYEPGYTQVVYLKVKNNGTVPFEFFTAVNVNDCTVATNVFGQQFMLQDYLKFGIVTAKSEAAIKNSVADREAAVKIADMPLHNYHTDSMFLSQNEIGYVALVVRMPEEADNFANYRGTPVPKVELGITVKADQIAN